MTVWQGFCVVGIGNHARTKLIPAIAANGQTLAGLVSRQLREALPDGPVFATLDEALAELPRDTAIVIASPPGLHHSQAAAAIDAGFDVIVEKPAFITAAEARDVSARCTARGTVLVEGFMQRYTGLYRRLLDYCAANPVAALDVAFVIPALPPNTFRGNSDPGSSSLYDIGCYILALLGDLGLDSSELDIVGVRGTSAKAEAVDLAGMLDVTRVTATLGVGPEYRNSVTVTLADGRATTFHPVFYGRAGTKTIGGDSIEDGNAFEAMLGTPRDLWLADQPVRLASMVALTARLETLAAQLDVLRAR